MSFILDALRKSEHERQRSAVPGLSHVPLATMRRELPGWAMLVIGALAAAVLVLGGAWWQNQRSLSTPVATSSAATAPPVASTPPLVAAPAPIAPAVAPPAVAAATVAPALPPPQETAVASTSLLPDSKSAAAPADLQSLSDAAFVPKEPIPMGPTLPSVTALLAQGIDVPPLKLELLGYSDKPVERFVFINGRKYKEGERLSEGPEVVQIERQGVVLSQHGQRFQLAPE